MKVRLARGEKCIVCILWANTMIFGYNMYIICTLCTCSKICVFESLVFFVLFFCFSFRSRFSFLIELCAYFAQITEMLRNGLGLVRKHTRRFEVQSHHLAAKLNTRKQVLMYFTHNYKYKHNQRTATAPEIWFRTRTRTHTPRSQAKYSNENT